MQVLCRTLGHRSSHHERHLQLNINNLLEKITTKENLMSVSHLMPGNNIIQILRNLKGHRCLVMKRGPNLADGQPAPNATSAIPSGTTPKPLSSGHPSAQQQPHPSTIPNQYRKIILNLEILPNIKCETEIIYKNYYATPAMFQNFTFRNCLQCTG